MHLLPLLGKSLKDDDVIDILEDMEIDVIYDFDRLHEGQPDKYWASVKEAGMQFRFDEAQTLDTVFLYIVPDEGFAACAQKDTDVPVFTTAAEVQAFGESHRLQIAKGRADFLGVISDWIRLGFGLDSAHTLSITRFVQAVWHESQLCEMHLEPPNHALQRTRHGVAGCNRGVPRAGSLSLGR